MNLNLLVFAVLMVNALMGGGGGECRTALLLFSSSSACKILMNVQNIIIKTIIKPNFAPTVFPIIILDVKAE